MGKFRCVLFAFLAFLAFDSFADTEAELKQVLIANYAATLEKMDAKAFAATTTPEVTIIDEFPPFVWTGKTSATQYLKAMADIIEKMGAKNFSIDVRDAVHISEDKNKAYAVFPVQVTFVDGESKNQLEQGYQTLVFTKSKNGLWLINTMTWATVNSDSD
jgi:ketosteroid isomerase-like protein